MYTYVSTGFTYIHTCSRHPSVSGDNGLCRACQLGLKNTNKKREK